MVLKKIGLTGASGMVGRHILALLNQRQIKCITASRTRADVAGDRTDWTYWDLTEWKESNELDLIFPEVNAIIHAGAIVPDRDSLGREKELHDANIRSCLALGAWALKKNIHVIFLSGAIVYADPFKIQITEKDRCGRSEFGGFYGLSKIIAEEIFEYFAAKGLRLTILRPSSIYGYGLSKNKMIMQFLSKASRGEIITLQPPFDDKIGLIHAFDVARALYAALNKRACGIFNVSDEGAFSILDIAEMCVRVVGSGSVEATIKPGLSATVRFNLSCNAAKSELDFSPMVSLEEGMLMTWQGTLIPRMGLKARKDFAGDESVEL